MPRPKMTQKEIRRLLDHGKSPHEIAKLAGYANATNICALARAWGFRFKPGRPRKHASRKKLSKSMECWSLLPRTDSGERRICYQVPRSCSDERQRRQTR